jgi:hypothetical protein
MPHPLPDFQLTHGQAMWALAYGQEPPRLMLDRVRYLRSLGIPFAPEEQVVGRGNRLRYDYMHLVETGFGLLGLSYGFRPRDIAAVLVDNRDGMRQAYAAAYLEQPLGALTADWVKSRGRIRPIIADEMFIRLHDRHGDAHGSFEVIGMDEAKSADELFEPVERFPGELARRVIPATRYILQWVVWALEAPVTPPGRKKGG